MSWPHAHLSLEFLPLLNELKSYFDRTMAWQDLEGSEKEAEAKNLVESYHQLVKTAPKTKDVSVASRDADLAFVEGALRALHLDETVVPEGGILDTAGSKTLSHFSQDFRALEGDEEVVRQTLVDVFKLSEIEQEAVQSRLEKTELEPLRLRKDLVALISTPFEGEKFDVQGLFDAIFPGANLDVKPDLIRSSTSFLFCVPFAGVEEMPDEHPRKIFYKRVKKVRQKDMENFPAFGPFRGEEAEESLVRNAAETLGITYENCCRLLSTMVTVLTLEDLDKFIVHDVWGHQWQALLFEFEDTYQGTASFVALPELSQMRKGRTFEELLRGPTTEEAWLSFLEAELKHRVITSTSGLFAEVLADAVEHKFLHVRPDLAHLMPSSSFLKMYPAKLDLTLHDLPLYIRFAVRSFTRLVERDTTRNSVKARFLEKNPEFDQDVLDKNLQEIVGWTQEYLKDWGETLEFEESKGNVVPNVIAQFALQFFEIVVACNESLAKIYEDRKLRSPYFALPLDLFVFSVASFYERDRDSNFWKIDEFIRICFEPRCSAFQRALNVEKS